MTSESLVDLLCSCEDKEVEEEIIENTQDPVSKKRGKEAHYFASFDTLKKKKDCGQK